MKSVASPVPVMASSEREVLRPTARTGHVAVCAGKLLIVWGGYQDDDVLMEDRYLPAAEVWLYHTDIERWHKHMTTGKVPPGTSGASAVVLENHMYIIGGHIELGNTNDVYRLNLQTWTWELLECEGLKMSPRDKFSAWEYKNKIYAFGGYGFPLDGFLQEHGDFCLDTSTVWGHRGWNNQVLILDLANKRWSNPKCKGMAPSPRAAHGSARVGKDVCIFGGRHMLERMNDLHMLDLETFKWSGRILIDEPCPAGRSWHTLTPMSHDQVFLYGGYTQNGEPLSDAWTLDVQRREWTQLNVPDDRPRLWHTASTSCDGDILVFGGVCNDILDSSQTKIHANDILAFRCSPKSLVRLCIDQVFAYRDWLKGEWHTLPKPLYRILKLKLEGRPGAQLENSDNVHSETSCHNEGHVQCQTCSVS